MEKYNLDDKGGLFKFVAKSPSKIVKQGDLVEFKHFGINNFIKATASDVTESSFIIRSGDKTGEVSINPGDHIMIFHTSGDVYVIIGEVGIINKIEPLDLMLKVIKIEKLKDLVKEKKHTVSLNASFKILGVSESKPAVVKSISYGGIKADCREDIMMEDIVEITIYIDKNNKMPFKGRVVRKNKFDGKYEYGIEYSEVMESSNKLLTRLMYDLDSRV